MADTVIIRQEKHKDQAAVYQVNKQAFDGRDEEPQLVEAIRRSSGFIPELSLVAVTDDTIVGHILFSIVRIETGQGDVPVLALAPLAVLPAYQNQGIGTQLTRNGLETCRQLGYKIVNVLGHPNYYPRFGFTQARPLGILPPDESIPEEAWMILELTPGSLKGIQGTLRYPECFETAM
ncbi:MAG: N-acetyltransferase [Anaerolineales bacterium]|nr:N-acetyltransferase [Anaerolineales bacterium]